MEDFFVQECCVHGTDLENHGPTSILCDDPLPIESNQYAILNTNVEYYKYYTAAKSRQKNILLSISSNPFTDFLRISKN